MAQKSLGYVELEWICPSCGNRNPGSAKKCLTCGTPQPSDVEFIEPVQEELLADPEKIEAARLGPDIHCPYCGARNRSDAEVCRNCGGPLQGGRTREAGAVVGAFGDSQVESVTCPACGTPNPPGARRCKKCGAGLVDGRKLEEEREQLRKAAARTGGGGRRFLIIAGLILLAIIAFFVFASRTDEQVGVVQDVNWERSIAVQEIVPVQKETWLDDIPAGAPVGSCRSRVARTQDQPAPGAVEVCGTPYTVDQGSGFGEVVQDCSYQIYEEWCEYTVEEWRAIDSIVSRGSGIQPAWPALSLDAGQQAGERSESYSVIFESNGETYTYQVRNPAELAQFAEGSRWILEVNRFGAVSGIQPAP